VRHRQQVALMHDLITTESVRANLNGEKDVTYETLLHRAKVEYENLGKRSAAATQQRGPSGRGRSRPRKRALPGNV